MANVSQFSSRINYLEVARALLRPVVRLLLRRGILLQDLIQVLKLVLVDVAEEELRRTTKKINTSRISVMTGVHRHDVTKIFRDRETNLPEEPITILARVLATWSEGKRYRNKAGKVRILSCDGDNSEFFKLVRSIARTINPATVMFELIRNGAAEEVPNGLRMKRQTSVLTGDDAKVHELLGKDVETLALAMEENLMAKQCGSVGNLHHRTQYDNIYQSDLPRIRKWILDQGRRFHKKLRSHLASYDKDLSPRRDEKEPAGGVVSITSFSLVSGAAGPSED